MSAVFAPDTICPPPLATQPKVTPGVVEDPLSDNDVVVHVSTLSAPALTFGKLASNVTTATSVAVHPLTGFVTVSVYVPAALTVGVAVVAPDTIFPPPLATQPKVTPGVVEVPSRAMDVVVHVSILSAPAFAFGGVLFRVTSATSVAVHPLTGFVTVSVYVPAASTIGVCRIRP